MMTEKSKRKKRSSENKALTTYTSNLKCRPLVSAKLNTHAVFHGFTLQDFTDLILTNLVNRKFGSMLILLDIENGENND